MSSKRDDDQTSIDEVMQVIKDRVPGAEGAEFQTSETIDFGFDLLDISTEGGPLSMTDYELFVKVEEQVHDRLYDIDWGSVMGEDEHGYIYKEVS